MVEAQGGAQIGFDRVALGNRLGHFRREQDAAIPASLLRLVKRDIGVAQ